MQRKTLDICIKNLGIKKYIDFSISNEEVSNSKPHPEIYLRSLIELNLKPKETLVIETHILVEGPPRNLDVIYIL